MQVSAFPRRAFWVPALCAALVCFPVVLADPRELLQAQSELELPVDYDPATTLGTYHVWSSKGSQVKPARLPNVQRDTCALRRSRSNRTAPSLL
jgi:hypothetical protein